MKSCHLHVQRPHRRPSVGAGITLQVTLPIPKAQWPGDGWEIEGLCHMRSPAGSCAEGIAVLSVGSLQNNRQRTPQQIKIHTNSVVHQPSAMKCLKAPESIEGIAHSGTIPSMQPWSTPLSRIVIGRHRSYAGCAVVQRAASVASVCPLPSAKASSEAAWFVKRWAHNDGGAGCMLDTRCQSGDGVLCAHPSAISPTLHKADEHLVWISACCRMT